LGRKALSHSAVVWQFTALASSIAFRTKSRDATSTYRSNLQYTRILRRVTPWQLVRPWPWQQDHSLVNFQLFFCCLKQFIDALSSLTSFTPS
jgi:hypothetical protein